MEQDPTNATLSYRYDVNEGLSIVRVVPDSGVVPRFEPGQFTTLGLPPAPGDPLEGRRTRTGQPQLVRRAYSIASSPRESEYLEFLIVRVMEGRLTPQLFDLTEGGRVFMDEKMSGRFTLDNVPADQDLVMVATGTGLAPFRSMFRTYRGQNRWRRFVLLHGVRNAHELAYRDEFEQAAGEDPSVLYVPMTTREPEPGPWTGLRGRVQAALQDGVYQDVVGGELDPARCHVFLCGNPVMIDETEKLLHARGFTTQTARQPGNLHFERYW